MSLKYFFKESTSLLIFVLTMRTVKQILFIVALTIFTLSQTQASTVVLNSTENKSSSTSIAEKYSLKNIGNASLKTSTFYTLRSSLEFKGMAANKSNANYLKFNKGNISYVIPYRYKMVLPRFKTPSPTQP
jgi:hypothetical protein